MSELIARVEQRLATNPADGQGWDVIGPVYLRLDRFQDAADAFSNAIRLLGETTPRLAGLAEALVMASNGIVTEPARRTYEKLAALEPDRIEPKFWLLLAKEQDGKTAEAAAGYRALLAGAPPDADWRPLVVERLAAVTGTKAPGTEVKSQSERGPSASDVKAASAMSDDDRGKMIAGMIDGLAQRLKSNGNDPAGWARLVNAYLVLGEKGKAEAAVADARKALANAETGAAAVRELEAMLISGPRNGKDTQ